MTTREGAVGSSKVQWKNEGVRKPFSVYLLCTSLNPNEGHRFVDGRESISGGESRFTRLGRPGAGGPAERRDGAAAPGRSAGVRGPDAELRLAS